MGSNHLSDNYYLRNHFLTTNEVPTQSLMKKKMSAPLAAVYFKSMTPKLKVLAGLEPPLKGGGGDWYVPPKDLLEGRSVLKPLKKQCLSKLNYYGIDSIGIKMLKTRLKRMQIERNKIIEESDERWKASVEVECQQFFENSSVDAAKKNTERIKHALDEFTHLYAASISSIENALFDAASNEITKIRNAAFQTMNEKFVSLIKQQAVTLYDTYSNKLTADKARLKDEFIVKLSVDRTEMGQKIHDLNLDKHAAIEKLRKYLEYQTLACQVYVALKERETFKNEINLSKHMHKKKVKILSDDIELKNYNIIRQVQKDKKRQEFSEIWHKKVLHIVKTFQKIILYSLNTLPEHAEFFINIEKLMLLQLNEVLDNPSAESIFEAEEEQHDGPEPIPHPFYLFCDKGYKWETSIEKDLCPKRCTSDASQMPVIIVNNRCMYAACDNFQQFTTKVKHFIHGNRGDDADFIDEHYEHHVPVKYTSSQQLLELKLESSLLQLLQQELPNIREIPIECGICKMTYCFCNREEAATASMDTQKKMPSIQQIPSQTKPFSNKITKKDESIHRREPKLDSYLNYVEPKKCSCPKRAKKDLIDNLPAYMRIQSVYAAPELPNYEKCSISTLKKMVKKARGSVTVFPPIPSVSKTRDVATQCSDLQFDALCNCFSDNELDLLRRQITGSQMYHTSNVDDHLDVIDSCASPTLYTRPEVSFLRGRIHSVRAVVGDSATLKELFKFSGRSFD